MIKFLAPRSIDNNNIPINSRPVSSYFIPDREHPGWSFVKAHPRVTRRRRQLRNYKINGRRVVTRPEPRRARKKKPFSTAKGSFSPPRTSTDAKYLKRENARLVANARRKVIAENKKQRKKAGKGYQKTYLSHLPRIHRNRPTNASNGIRFGEAENPGPDLKSKKKKKVWKKKGPLAGGNRLGRSPTEKEDPTVGGKRPNKGGKSPEPMCDPCQLKECFLPRHRHANVSRGGGQSGKKKNHALARIARSKTKICLNKRCKKPHLHCVDVLNCDQLCCKVEEEDVIASEDESSDFARYYDIGMDMGLNQNDFAEMHSGTSDSEIPLILSIPNSPEVTLKKLAKTTEAVISKKRTYVDVVGQKARTYLNDLNALKQHRVVSRGAVRKVKYHYCGSDGEDSDDEKHLPGGNPLKQVEELALPARTLLEDLIIEAMLSDWSLKKNGVKKFEPIIVPEITPPLLPPASLDMPSCVSFRQASYKLAPDGVTLVPEHLLGLTEEVYFPDFPEEEPPSEVESKELSTNLSEVKVHSFGLPHEEGIKGWLRKKARRVAPYLGGDLNTDTRDGSSLTGTGGFSFSWVSKKIFLQSRGVAYDYYLSLGLETWALRPIFLEMALQLMACSKSLPKPSTLSDGRLVVNGQYTNGLDFYIRRNYISFFQWMETQGEDIPRLREAYEYTLCYISTEMAVNHLRNRANQSQLRTVQFLRLGGPQGIVQDIGMTKTYTSNTPTLDAYRDNNLFDHIGSFTPEGLLDVDGLKACLPKGLKIPMTYTSRNGGALHSAEVPTKTLTQSMCALTRLTNAVEPAKIGYHEAMLINGYSHWNTIDFDSIYDFPRFEAALTQVEVDMEQLYREASLHPTKGKEYTLCLNQNLSNGLLIDAVESDGRMQENTAKQKVEKSKSNSEARLYVTLGPKSAMVGAKASKVLKQARADEPLYVESDDGSSCGAIYFVPRPNRGTMNEWAKFCTYGCDYNPDPEHLPGGNPLKTTKHTRVRFIIFNHSDDMDIMREELINGIWVRTFHTVDISKCDKSHGAIFDHFWRFWISRFDLYDLLEAQLMRDIRVDVNGVKMKTWLRPKSPVLLSGHSWTTLINNFATDILGVSFIRNGCKTPQNFVDSAYNAGYRIKVDVQSNCKKTDFLKHCPAVDVHGAPVAVPMLGNLMRFYNYRIGDVPGIGDANLRWALFNSNNIKSCAHGIKSPWIDTMLKGLEKSLLKKPDGRLHLAVLHQQEDRMTLRDKTLMKAAKILPKTRKHLKLAKKNIIILKEESNLYWSHRRELDKKYAMDEVDYIPDTSWVSRYVDDKHSEASLLATLQAFATLKEGEYLRDENIDHIMKTDYSLTPPLSWCEHSPGPDPLYTSP